MPGVAQAPRHHAMATRFAAWLSELEEKYRFILLETDATASNWTQRCVQHSDQVIILGLGEAQPSLGELEPLIDAQRQVGSVPKRLVLFHPGDRERPSGTSRWLDRLPADMHHHIRRHNRADYQRLARFLTGSAIGVALGGGGARGFAHMGAFKALSEAGIPIDIVVGTSMGAVIGAEYALGMPPEEMLSANRSMFRNVGLLMDVTLPLLSFTSGKAYSQTLMETFGDVTIEDLWTPFFCVSSNISRAVMAVHRRGALRQKVRASSGVQGLFPPMVMDGDLHVDGALFSNLPADVMKTVCRGYVIAVDVTPPVDLAENTDYGDTISGWAVLWKRLRGGAEFHSTDLGTIMQRSGEAASMANQRRVIATVVDYYLRMPVEEVHLMNFGAIDRLFQIGYDTAKTRIAEWRARESGSASIWRR
jgi:predicted acylesterase/phospholipase RssA